MLCLAADDNDITIKREKRKKYKTNITHSILTV